MGWIWKTATKVPLNAPQTTPIRMPPKTPTTSGTASSFVEETPYPARSMQQKLAHRLITEPTEISVPAEEDTTSVMPMARIAASLPRFRISMIRPYRTTPLLVVFCSVIIKNENGLLPDAISKTMFTAMTRIRDTIGRSRFELLSRPNRVFFFMIPVHLPQLLS